MDRRLKLGHSIYGMWDGFLFPFLCYSSLLVPVTHMDMPRSFKGDLKKIIPGQTTEDKCYF